MSMGPKLWWGANVALVVAIVTVSVVSLGGVATAQAPQVFEAAGDDPADIQQAVDAFRAALGPTRQEINWDAVPDQFSAPNNLPPNFFNANVPRGVVFFTPGTGFQVSADADNPTNTPIEFGNLDPVFPNLFATFSPPRLFTALKSPIVEILFFVPGTQQAAATTGFGAVFTDVDRVGVTKIEYFDANGGLLFSRHVTPVPNRDQTLSFLGVVFDSPRVYLVRITSGNFPVGEQPPGPEASTPGDPSASGSGARTNDQQDASGRGGGDAVVMDDFIFGLPQVLGPSPSPTSTATPAVSPTSTATPAVSPTSTATPAVSPTSTATPEVSPTSTSTPPSIPTSTSTPTP